MWSDCASGETGKKSTKIYLCYQLVSACPSSTSRVLRKNEMKKTEHQAFLAVLCRCRCRFGLACRKEQQPSKQSKAKQKKKSKITNKRFARTNEDQRHERKATTKRQEGATGPHVPYHYHHGHKPINLLDRTCRVVYSSLSLSLSLTVTHTHTHLFSETKQRIYSIHQLKKQ